MEGRDAKGLFSSGNKFALGLSTSGANPIYKDETEMVNKIGEYFESLLFKQEDGEPEKEGYKTRPTITGLALYLGFCSRQSLYDYVKKSEFSYIITRAQQIVAMSYEEMLLTKVSAGAIFALKNMGWDDKSIVEQTNITPPKIEFTDEEE